tara:strand:- start:2608 stop:3348 length:741 start_codon:yes stop_codon:yes gene_type:complete
MLIEIKDNSNIIFQVDSYAGRLGNQIGYIARALFISKIYKVNSIILPETCLTKKLEIILNKSNVDKKILTIKKKGIYDLDKLYKNLDKNYSNIKYDRKLIKDCFQELFVPHLKYNLYDEKITENIFLHIRSGDKISNLPPLNFFTRSIDNEKNKKIHVVSEDFNNKIYRDLKEKYGERLIFQSKSLIEDLKTLLKAETLITCHSTFTSNAVYYLSRNIKKMYLIRSHYEKYKEFDSEKCGINMILL